MNRIYKKQATESDVWQLACERAEYCYRTFDHVAVFFSGGKDSTATLHVALEVATQLKKLPVHVVHYDEEAIPPETVDYVRRVYNRDDVELSWFCIPLKHRNAASRRSPWWYPWAPEDRERWCRPLPPEAITKVAGFKRQTTPQLEGIVCPPSLGTVCAMMGIRTDESLNRYMAVAAGKRGFHSFLSRHQLFRHVTKAYPIYDWHVDDVWLAPELFGWDYNRSYDVMSLAGIPPSQQRIAPPFGEQPLLHLWKFAICWPDLWAKMSERVPGAATAARWVDTELYGVAGSAKPDNMSWRDYCYMLLSRMPAVDRAKVAENMRSVVAHHRKQTRRPLPDETPDPDSGLCWKNVATIVERGDIKGRVAVGVTAAANTRSKEKRSRRA